MSQIKITAASLKFFLSVRVSKGEKKKIKVGRFLEANQYLSLEPVNRIGEGGGSGPGAP